MSYELSSVAVGMEEVGKSGYRIEGESVSSIALSVSSYEMQAWENQCAYLLLPH